MRRSGFKRPAYSPPPSAPLRPLEKAPRYGGGVDIDAVHFRHVAPKFSYVRSDALMASFRKIACQACGLNDGTVCGAHSNWSIHGKGRSIKASDIYCASLCSQCHSDLDQGSQWTETERKAVWWQAHVRTVRKLVERELWPIGITVPDVSRSPWE